MGKSLYHIKINDLCKLIVLTLLNKFDFFLVVEGNTGTGKSTLAIHIATSVRREFKKLYKLDENSVQYYYDKVIEKQNISMEEFCKFLLELKERKAYIFNPYEDLIYNQDTMMKGLTSRNRIIIPDELVNIAFNRDFAGDKNKKIIKLINMHRDFNNLIISCIPNFPNLDIQIKNLTKMRISIAKRGAGVIQTPNHIIYGKDKWDTALNEKIEHEWLIHGGKPHYTRLTTARGIISFPPLSKKVEEQYIKIKHEKRGKIVQEDFGVIVGEKEKTPEQKVYDELIAGHIRNSHQLEGFALAIGLKPEALRQRIVRLLNKNFKIPSLQEYFWDKRGKKYKEEESFVPIP